MLASQRHSAAACMAVVLLMLPLHVPHARHTSRGPGDTIANVAAAGKHTLSVLTPAQAGLADAQAVVNRMLSDAQVQKDVLNLVNKKDTAGLTAYLQKLVPNAPIQVTKASDFVLGFGFSVRGHQVEVCISNEKGCGGRDGQLHNATVTVK